MTGRELVQIVFGADISGLEAQALAVGRSMDKLGHRLRTLGIVTGLVFGGIAVSSAKAFAQVEYSTAQIATLMDDVSTDTIPQLRNEIMQLGVDFGQTFETMAKARYDVVSAGFRSIEESIMLMESANRLALAGAAEVGPTAKLVAQALRGYGKGAEYAAMMSDQLFQVVKFGVTTVPELTSSMGRIYSTARAAGVGVEQLHAAVSILTAVTGNSNESVNALNRLLFAMAAPTSQAAKALDKAGIRVIDYEGKVLSLVKVIEQFRGKNAGQVKELIGGRINAAKALIIMAQNTEQYKEALLAMIMAQGSVTKAALLMGEQTKKTFDTMVQSANRLRVVIGETLDKDVRKNLGDITHLLNKMANAENKATADFIWGGLALSKWALIAALTTKVTKGLAIALTQANITSLTLSQTWARINWTALLHPITGLKNAFGGFGGSMAAIGATQIPIFMSGLGLLFGGLFAIDVIVRDAYKHIGELFELRPETEDWRKLEAIVKKTGDWTEELTALTTKYADVVEALNESMKDRKRYVGPGLPLEEVSPKLGRKAQEEWTDLLNISGEITNNINSTTLAAKDLMRVMQESGIYSVMAVDKQIDAIQNQITYLEETKTLIDNIATATGRSAEYIAELFRFPNIESGKQKLQAIVDLLLQIKQDTLAAVGFRGLDEANIMLRPPIEPDIEHMEALKNAVAGVATEADWLASEFINVFEAIKEGSSESAEEVIETGEKFIDLRNLAQKLGDTVDEAALNARELFWVIEVAGQRATNVFLEQRASAERLAWALKQTGKEHINALQKTANELLTQITYLEETNRMIKEIARTTGETPEVIAKFFDFPNIFSDLDILNEQLRETLRIMMEIRRTEKQREFKPTPGFYAYGRVSGEHPWNVADGAEFKPADLFTSLQVLWGEMEDESRYSSETIRAAWSTTFTEGAGMFSDLANVASRARDDVLSAWFDVGSSLLIMIDTIVKAIEMKTLSGLFGGIGAFIGALSVLDQARDRRRAGAGTRRYPTGSGVIPGVGVGHTQVGLFQPGEAILSRESVKNLVRGGNRPSLSIGNVNVTLENGSMAEADAAAKRFVLTTEEEFAKMYRRAKLQGRLN